jgi:hypothetical protein
MKHFMIATSLIANINTMMIIGQQYWNNENTMKKVPRALARLRVDAVCVCTSTMYKQRRPLLPY